MSTRLELLSQTLYSPRPPLGPSPTGPGAVPTVSQQQQQQQHCQQQSRSQSQSHGSQAALAGAIAAAYAAADVQAMVDENITHRSTKAARRERDYQRTRPWFRRQASHSVTPRVDSGAVPIHRSKDIRNGPSHHELYGSSSGSGSGSRIKRDTGCDSEHDAEWKPSFNDVVLPSLRELHHVHVPSSYDSLQYTTKHQKKHTRTNNSSSSSSSSISNSNSSSNTTSDSNRTSQHQSSLSSSKGTDVPPLLLSDAMVRSDSFDADASATNWDVLQLTALSSRRSHQSPQTTTRKTNKSAHNFKRLKAVSARNIAEKSSRSSSRQSQHARDSRRSTVEAPLMRRVASTPTRKAQTARSAAASSSTKQRHITRAFHDMTMGGLSEVSKEMGRYFGKEELQRRAEDPYVSTLSELMRNIEEKQIRHARDLALRKDESDAVQNMPVKSHRQKTQKTHKTHKTRLHLDMEFEQSYKLQNLALNSGAPDAIQAPQSTENSVVQPQHNQLQLLDNEHLQLQSVRSTVRKASAQWSEMSFHEELQETEPVVNELFMQSRRGSIDMRQVAKEIASAKDSQDAGFVDIMSLLKHKHLSYIKQDFQALGGALDLNQFIAVMRTYINADEVGSLCLTRSLCRFFSNVDVNNDGTMEWDEFTGFIVDKGLTSSQNAMLLNTIQPYTRSDSIDPIDRADITEFVKYLPKLDVVVARGVLQTSLAVYNPSTMKLITTIAGHRGAVLSVAYNSKLDWLITSSNDRNIRFWNVRDNYAQVNCQLKVQHAIISMVYSEAHDVLIGASDQGELRSFSFLHDIKISHGTEYTVTECSAVRRAHSDFILDILLIEDQDTVVTGSLDTTIKLWDIATLRLKQVMHGHSKGVAKLSFHPQFRMLFSAGFEAEAFVWNTGCAKNICTLSGHYHPLVAIHAIPGTPQVITADRNGTAKVWDIRNFACVESFRIETRAHAHLAAISDFTACPKHKRIVFAAARLHAYDCTSRVSELRPVVADVEPTVVTQYVSRNSRFVTAGGSNLKQWDEHSGRLLSLHSEITSHDIMTANMDVAEKRLAVGDANGRISIVNLQSFAVLKRADTNAMAIQTARLKLEEQTAELSQRNGLESSSNNMDTKSAQSAAQIFAQRRKQMARSHGTNRGIQLDIFKRSLVSAHHRLSQDNESYAIRFSGFIDGGDAVLSVNLRGDVYIHELCNDDTSMGLRWTHNVFGRLGSQNGSNPPAEVTCACSSDNLALAAVGCSNGLVVLIDTMNRRILGTLDGHSSAITTVLPLDPYPAILVCDMSGNVCVWAVRPALTSNDSACILRLLNTLDNQPNPRAISAVSSAQFLPRVQMPESATNAHSQHNESSSNSKRIVQADLLCIADVRGHMKVWRIDGVFRRCGLNPFLHPQFMHFLPIYKHLIGWMWHATGPLQRSHTARFLMKLRDSALEAAAEDDSSSSSDSDSDSDDSVVDRVIVTDSSSSSNRKAGTRFHKSASRKRTGNASGQAQNSRNNPRRVRLSHNEEAAFQTYRTLSMNSPDRSYENLCNFVSGRVRAETALREELFERRTATSRHALAEALKDLQQSQQMLHEMPSLLRPGDVQLVSMWTAHTDRVLDLQANRLGNSAEDAVLQLQQAWHKLREQFESLDSNAQGDFKSTTTTTTTATTTTSHTAVETADGSAKPDEPQKRTLLRRGSVADCLDQCHTKVLFDEETDFALYSMLSVHQGLRNFEVAPPAFLRKCLASTDTDQLFLATTSFDGRAALWSVFGSNLGRLEQGSLHLHLKRSEESKWVLSSEQHKATRNLLRERHAMHVMTNQVSHTEKVTEKLKKARLQRELRRIQHHNESTSSEQIEDAVEDDEIADAIHNSTTLKIHVKKAPVQVQVQVPAAVRECADTTANKDVFITQQDTETQ
jgi:WD40 repeat protein